MKLIRKNIFDLDVEACCLDMIYFFKKQDITIITDKDCQNLKAMIKDIKINYCPWCGSLIENMKG